MITSKALSRRAAACVAALAAAAAASVSAQARDLPATFLTLDVAAGTSESQIYQVPYGDPVVLTSATTIIDGAFTYLDLSLILTGATTDLIQKMVDQGYSSEPSGCAPGVYAPLDMEDGLRYFFELGAVAARPGGPTERVRVTAYPGNRTTHWANDVSCEYSTERGDDTAVLRMTGYFYVIHRRLEDGTDIQLRAVVPTDEEVDAVSQLIQTRTAEGR